MSNVTVSTSPRSDASQSMNRGAALFVALLLTAGLGALAFWPESTGATPRRPGLHTPIVFDEFVNPPPPASATSSATDPAAR